MRRQFLTILRWPDRAFRRMLPRRIRRMLFFPLSIVAIGTVGYPLIEGPKWALFDGLYMTVITLTTLGYGEIPEPLSRPGRAFTMALALGGIFILFFIASEIIRIVVTGEMRDLLGRERMDDQLRHLDGHTIVCGYGRMGRIVCEDLERFGRPFVAIDSVAPSGEWNHKHGLRFQGNAAEDEVLRHAGIERAKALITVVGSDADNLYITLSARLLNPQLVIVARAEEEAAEAKLLKVGANKVVSPYLVGGHRAVQAVLKPGVLHFMESATRDEFMDMQVEELRVDPTSKLAGQTLRASRICNDFGVLVVGMIQPNGKVLHAPPGDTLIEAASILIIIGQKQQMQSVEQLAAAS